MRINGEHPSSFRLGFRFAGQHGQQDGAQAEIIVLAERGDQEPRDGNADASQACKCGHGKLLRPGYGAAQRRRQRDGAGEIGRRQFRWQDDEPVARNIH